MVPNCSVPNFPTILYCGLYMLYIQLHCGLYMIYILLYCGLYMIYILLYIINSSCLPIYLYFRSRLLKSNIFSLLSKIEFLQRHTWSLLCVTFGYLCDIFCCLPSSKYICYFQNPDDETIKNGQWIHKGASKNFTICWLFWTSAVNDYDSFDSDDANHDGGGDDNYVKSY